MADANQAAVMGEDGQDQDQQQTVEIPLSAMPSAKEGATISLKVISVDSQNGVINAVAMQAPVGTPNSDGLADELEQNMQKQ